MWQIAAAIVGNMALGTYMGKKNAQKNYEQAKLDSVRNRYAPWHGAQPMRGTASGGEATKGMVSGLYKGVQMAQGLGLTGGGEAGETAVQQEGVNMREPEAPTSVGYDPDTFNAYRSDVNSRPPEYNEMMDPYHSPYAENKEYNIPSWDSSQGKMNTGY